MSIARKPYAIGVDFGGTNTKIALIDRRGRIHGEIIFPSRECLGPEPFARRLGEEMHHLLSHTHVSGTRVAGVGIGLPGLIDPVRGMVHTLVNVPGWEGRNAAALFRKYLELADASSRIEMNGLFSTANLKLPVYLENDVNAMALGELCYGSAKGYCNVVCVTLGTGVGGGLILDGKLYHGASLTAGEIGHIVVDSRGPVCNCGSRGCLEAFIGTQGLLRRTAHLLRQGRQSILRRWTREGKKLSPLLLAQAAKEGDRVAVAVWHEAARYLGIVFAGIANLINPDLFIIGGGVSGVGSYFFDQVRATLRSVAMSVPGRRAKVIRSRLGNRAGVIGAASIVFDRIYHKP